MRVRQDGFTLIELMVTLAIAAILAVVGVPAFQETIKNNRMTTLGNQTLGALMYARMESVKRGGDVSIGQRAAGSWAGGTVVWINPDGDAIVDPGEEVLRLWDALPASNTLISAGGKTVFIFNASGFVDLADTLTICDDRTAEKGLSIKIGLTGLIFIEDVTCS